MRLKCMFSCLVCLSCLIATGSAAQTPRSLFDPARHMRVSEVKPGMKGYGLSVFQGTKIERFEVEVVSVLRNFNPKHDVVLIKCTGGNLEHTGAVAGMSGSPIYLTDEHGRERMIGAFAYGWPMLKDPLAGVQPIEYMLDVPPEGEKPPVAASQPGANSPNAIEGVRAGAAARPNSNRPIRWSIGEVFPLPGRESPPGFPVTGLSSLDPNPDYFELRGRDPSRLQALATPLMVGGVPSKLLDAYTPLLRASGLVPLQSGGGGSPQADAENSAMPIQPGSTLAVPLVTGDIDFTLIGTATEVIGDRVFGFGHPFLSEGPVSLPLGLGQVHAILAKLDQSMKLGSLVKLQGAMTSDHSTGVSGTLGDTPRTAPIELRVTYADGSQDVTYRYDAAIHPKLTPILGGIALSAAIGGLREPPQYHTLQYDLKIEFANGQVVECSDVAVNMGRFWPLQTIVFPLIAASENPFERASLSKLTGTVRVLPEAREAEILSVHVPRLKYKPGETIKAFVTYRPFRAPEAILPIELKLPQDLSDGTYQLVVAGWSRFVADEQLAQPFRFTAESGPEVFAVLRDVMSLRHDALYVRLMRQPDGVAVGRVAMPRLPSSRRQILLGSGRSNTAPFVSSTVKIVPTDFVMKGAADFQVEIDAQERIESPAGRVAKPDPHAPPAPSEPRTPPKAGKIEPPMDIDKPDKGKSDSPSDGD